MFPQRKMWMAASELNWTPFVTLNMHKDYSYFQTPPLLSPECVHVAGIKPGYSTHNGHFSHNQSLHGMQPNPFTSLNHFSPKVYPQHYIIWNVPRPCLLMCERLHHWPKKRHHHSLPPVPLLHTLCHFYADWKSKRNLLGVIWCDATNPNATNHRSRPPCSAQTPASSHQQLYICLR